MDSDTLKALRAYDSVLQRLAVEIGSHEMTKAQLVETTSQLEKLQPSAGPVTAEIAAERSAFGRIWFLLTGR